MAIGKSISEGDHEFDTIVAVAHPHPHEDIENVGLLLHVVCVEN